MFVRYDVGKPGALEKQLETTFAQRFEHDTPKLWKKKKWMPAIAPGASLAAATFALGDGQCTFTIPADPAAAEPLRDFLASKKVKNLELRVATAADIAAKSNPRARDRFAEEQRRGRDERECAAPQRRAAVDSHDPVPAR